MTVKYCEDIMREIPDDGAEFLVQPKSARTLADSDTLVDSEC